MRWIIISLRETAEYSGHANISQTGSTVAKNGELMITWNAGRTNLLRHSSFCKGPGQPYYISTLRKAPTANHKTTILGQEKQSSSMRQA